MSTLDTILLVAILLILLVKKTSPSPMSKNSTRKVILDTCALIDGRIVELTKSGFVPDQLIIPNFIVHELQMLADGSDSQKRSRARYGLDVIKELQSIDNTNVIINEEFKGDTKMPTDDKLIVLSKQLHSPLYTTDYNLNKVAEIQGLTVLNVNELANQLRPEILPGEQKLIKIIQKGSNHLQGVGYLEDGTMIVVNNAAKYIGKAIDVEIVRSLQTAAGKMLFAEAVIKK